MLPDGALVVLVPVVEVGDIVRQDYIGGRRVVHAAVRVIVVEAVGVEDLVTENTLAVVCVVPVLHVHAGVAVTDMPVAPAAPVPAHVHDLGQPTPTCIAVVAVKYAYVGMSGCVVVPQYTDLVPHVLAGCFRISPVGRC